VTSTTTTIHKGTVVMGANVVLQEGPAIGRVEDFVITDGGCIDYVVVSYNSKYVLVPWTVATWTGDRAIRLNITETRFREVPTFTRDAWPNFSDTQYIQRVRTAWGVTDSRYGDPNRQPLDRRDDRRDAKDQRRDTRDDRRDVRDQRKDVENPNRPPADAKDRRDDRRDTRDDRRDTRDDRRDAKDKNKDKDRTPPRPPDRPPPPPPPPDRPPQ
jgi:hypothetical protein